jgi:protein-L-isoaspartate(D-aspartate) O-methyltransferase
VTNEAHKISLIMELRRQGIRDQAVLDALERVPRELFVPETFSSHSYENHALPIECGQTISQPYVVAAMTQALDLNDRHKVLEVGTGSGYQASILSHLCRRVYTIERYRTLHRQAQSRFDELKLTNITAMVGDGSKGWPEQAPFDRIIVTAAAPEIPQILVDQLKIDGIMVVPVAKDPDVQTLVTIIRKNEGIERKDLFTVRFVPLVEGVAKEL